MKDLNPSDDAGESKPKIHKLQSKIEDLIDNVGKDLTCTYFFW